MSIPTGAMPEKRRLLFFRLGIHEIQEKAGVGHLHIGFQPKKAYAKAEDAQEHQGQEAQLQKKQPAALSAHGAPTEGQGLLCGILRKIQHQIIGQGDAKSHGNIDEKPCAKRNAGV